MQSKILGILKWFHKFCVDNNLRYYILGGTLIGAVRHQGFIPWDDDIDVGMPRKDYDRFLEMTKGKIFDHFKVEENCDSSDVCYHLFTKVYDVNTTVIEKTRNQIKRGVWIDVFPLDGIGNTKDEVYKNYNKLSRLEKILYTRQCIPRKERVWYKNLAIRISQLLPNFLVNDMELARRINLLLRKYDFDNSKYVGNLVGSYFEKEIVEKSVFGVPKLYKFEDTEVYGVNDYDAYLKNVYGNYMKLPPIEKRLANHDFILVDLNKSYLD